MCSSFYDGFLPTGLLKVEVLENTSYYSEIDSCFLLSNFTVAALEVSQCGITFV